MSTDSDNAGTQPPPEPAPTMPATDTSWITMEIIEKSGKQDGLERRG